MAVLNVQVSDEAYRRAKIAAAQHGELLRLFVERVILEATEKATEPGADLKERRYEPVE